jgi:hypothetical protein
MGYVYYTLYYLKKLWCNKESYYGILVVKNTSGDRLMINGYT